MTFRRVGSSGRPASAKVRAGAQRGTRYTGLRLTCLAATIMLLVQGGFGYEIAQNVNVPAADAGSGIFTAVGRSFSNGPVTLAVHTGLGLILIITALSAVLRAILARHNVVLIISVVGLAAILIADVNGARFVGNGQQSASTGMEQAGVVALLCYLVSLYVLRTRRSRNG
jgi:hypothetical protein